MNNMEIFQKRSKANWALLQTVEKPLFCIKQDRGSLRIVEKRMRLC